MDKSIIKLVHIIFSLHLGSFFLEIGVQFSYGWTAISLNLEISLNLNINPTFNKLSKQLNIPVNGDGVSDTESQIKLRRIFFDLKKRNYCDCDL